MIDRKDVVKIAREWIGTPFRNCASIKGVGVDCAGLLAGVFKEAGLLTADFSLEKYNWQHALHHSEELYLKQIAKYFVAATESNALPGDIILFNHGKTFSHSGIITDFPFIVHAVRFGVCEVNSKTDGFLQGRNRLYFTINPCHLT